MVIPPFFEDLGADAPVVTDAEGNPPGPPIVTPPLVKVVPEWNEVPIELTVHPSNANRLPMYDCVSAELMLHVPCRHVVRPPSGGLSCVPKQTQDPTVPLCRRRSLNIN